MNKQTQVILVHDAGIGNSQKILFAEQLQLNTLGRML
jgi:hypothetical protein